MWDQTAWRNGIKQRAGLPLCGPGPVGRQAIRGQQRATDNEGWCMYCGSAVNDGWFRDHYSCIQRRRQLSVRAVWAMGEA